MEEITLLQGGVHTFVLNDDESDAEPDLIDFVLTKGKKYEKCLKKIEQFHASTGSSITPNNYFAFSL